MYQNKQQVAILYAGKNLGNMLAQLTGKTQGERSLKVFIYPRLPWRAHKYQSQLLNLNDFTCQQITKIGTGTVQFIFIISYRYNLVQRHMMFTAK